MEDEIIKDEKFWNERWRFVNYCMLHSIVFILEEKQKRSSSPDVAKNVEKYKKVLPSFEEGYLNYKKWILSKFGKSGMETVLGIAVSLAAKKSMIMADLTNISPKDHAGAVDDECADVCASLAKWEYEARHFKHIRRIAYATAFVLSVSGVISAIDLFSK